MTSIDMASYLNFDFDDTPSAPDKSDEQHNIQFSSPLSENPSTLQDFGLMQYMDLSSSSNSNALPTEFLLNDASIQNSDFASLNLNMDLDINNYGDLTNTAADLNLLNEHSIQIHPSSLDLNAAGIDVPVGTINPAETNILSEVSAPTLNSLPEVKVKNEFTIENASSSELFSYFLEDEVNKIGMDASVGEEEQSSNTVASTPSGSVLSSVDKNSSIDSSSILPPQPQATRKSSSKSQGKASSVQNEKPTPSTRSSKKSRSGNSAAVIPTLSAAELSAMLDDDSIDIDAESTKQAINKLPAKERRQIKNRLSARAFRQRRKEYITTLEAQVKDLQDNLEETNERNKDLETENKKLKEQVDCLSKEFKKLKVDYDAIKNMAASNVSSNTVPTTAVSSKLKSTSAQTIYTAKPLTVKVQRISSSQSSAILQPLQPQSQSVVPSKRPRLVRHSSFHGVDPSSLYLSSPSGSSSSSSSSNSVAPPSFSLGKCVTPRMNQDNRIEVHMMLFPQFYDSEGSTSSSIVSKDRQLNENSVERIEQLLSYLNEMYPAHLEANNAGTANPDQQTIADNDNAEWVNGMLNYLTSRRVSDGL